MPLLLKHAREPPSEADGARILVDRLWPRGLSKTRLQLSEWRKDVAPSTELRRRARDARAARAACASRMRARRRVSTRR